ncbi:hypothetical protein PLICBS_004342 [Purpureocillium lilacinum]|uniref:uncharacterized protein n=1 Tax=Purpureocillium lilacinum TaxID=33203 RepID=UPI00207E4E33|nr:hypothetical protein PLICBS_004342 [Purpureocillium lilacinum]
MLTILGIDSLGWVMCLAPQTQLFEDIACRKYYSLANRVHVLDAGGKDLCKIPEVQDTVAQLFGWQAFFDGLPGLLLAMPYGVMADKRWFELPLRLTWLSSLFTIIGGGGTVASAVLMMVLADSTTEENRSRIFFQGNAVLIFAELIGPSLSTLMMQSNVWLPLIFALACTILTTFLSAFLPETLPPKAVDAATDQIGDEYSPSLNKASKKTLSVLFLVVSFLVIDFSRQSLAILLQYVSTRYSVPIAKANLLLSCKSFAQLIASAVLLPITDSFVLNTLRVPAKVKDLRLARMSISLVMVGFAVLVLAPSVWVVIVGLVFYTMGSGFGAFARSLVSSLVESRMIGTLFTTLCMMNTIGSLIAGPIVAGTFSWSLRLGGILRGMPFIFPFVLCGLATLALMQVKLPSRLAIADEPEDEESRGLLRSEGPRDGD